MLSTKLVNAINHQTNLDDTLQHTRHELEAAKRRIIELETHVKEHEAMVSEGVLVKKADVDATMGKLNEEMIEARKQRDTSDKGRRQMETELENLTTSLFEEANEVSRNTPDRNQALLTFGRWLQLRERRPRPQNARTPN